MNEIAKAREDGIFQGKVLAFLEDITKNLKRLQDEKAVLDVKVDTKADKSDFKVLEDDVRNLQKITWMGLGGLAILQVVVGYFLSKS